MKWTFVKKTNLYALIPIQKAYSDLNRRQRHGKLNQNSWLLKKIGNDTNMMSEIIELCTEITLGRYFG